MRDLECIIHIGAHKTGTSTLQEILYNHTSSSDDRRLAYPRSCIWPYDRSHNLLGIYFWDDIRLDLQTTPFIEVVNKIMSEAAGFERLFISSEMLEKVAIRGNMRIRDFLEYVNARGYRIRILYVVRRQDHTVNSIFKQWVAGFDTKFKDDPLDISRDELEDMKYARIADVWWGLKWVSEIVIVPVVRGNFLATLRSIGQKLDLGYVDFDQARDIVANISLDGLLLRLKHYINRFPFDREFNEEFLSISRAIAEKVGRGKRRCFRRSRGKPIWLTSNRIGSAWSKPIGLIFRVGGRSRAMAPAISFSR